MTVLRVLRRLKAIIYSLPKRLFNARSANVSSDYALITNSASEHADGWQREVVAMRQHEAYMPLLEAARMGNPRQDLIVAARAVADTGVDSPLILEVGCGSGYYSEILPLMLQKPIRYIGFDYAFFMTSLGRKQYPTTPFLTADATHLPFASACCDIVFNGGSLMHIPDYSLAIRESARCSKAWCIFHTVPVMKRGSTTFLQKRAYGEVVSEVIFHKEEIEQIFRNFGLKIVSVYDSIPYTPGDIIKEPIWTETYLCAKL